MFTNHVYYYYHSTTTTTTTATTTTATTTQAILTTMDITTDGFGFMLAFGDLAWVPFIYSLQARYLVDHDPSLSLWQVAVVVVVHMLGYYIFRSANSEKDAFRRDPEDPAVRHLR